MVKFLLLAFAIILMTTIFGFGGSLAAGAFETAKILFYIIVGMFLLMLMLGPALFRRR